MQLEFKGLMFDIIFVDEFQIELDYQQVLDNMLKHLGIPPYLTQYDKDNDDEYYRIGDEQVKYEQNEQKYLNELHKCFFKTVPKMFNHKPVHTDASNIQPVYWTSKENW
jgi:hypothetical protein